MKVQSPPGSGPLFIPHDGDAIQVPPDESVEVPDDIGSALLAQGWFSPDKVPATVAEILDWVDDDPVRATSALADEEAKADPRSSLVSRLEAIIDKEND